MTHGTIPLPDLAQLINQQQLELDKLRQDYEARQALLTELTRRKEALQTQLQQVEAELQGVGQGSPLPTAPAVTEPTVAAPATPTKVAATKPETKPGGTLTLSQLLIQIVSEAGRPLPVKELADEVVRRKHPTTSRNIPALVADQVKKLVKNGTLRRAPKKQGVLLPRTKAKAPAAPTSHHSEPATKHKPAAPKVAKSTLPASTANALPLPTIVTKILTESAEPIPGRELAAKILASGYQTKSKDFLNVLWVGIGKMDNVENVPGKGYRLKKGKPAPSPNEGKGTGSK